MSLYMTLHTVQSFGVSRLRHPFTAGVIVANSAVLPHENTMREKRRPSGLDVPDLERFIDADERILSKHSR